MSEDNDIKNAIKKLKLLTYNGKTNVEVFRRKLDDAYKTVFLPNHVECNEITYGNVKCDFLVPELYSTNRVMLYIHGGSYVGGSRLAYRSFCSSLATKCFSRVVVPEYRLAPSFPYPSAIEDIQAVFKSLFTEEQISSSLNSDRNGKTQIPEFYIAADGSAASIVCSLIFNLRDKYRNCIKKIIFFSPWLDASPESRLLSAKKISDEVLSGEVIRKSSSTYTFESNTKTPFISPLLGNEEEFRNFPSTYIQMGEKEILLDDAKEFVEKLKSFGNECELDVWPGMIYMFQMADEYIHESHLALDKIGKVVTESASGDSEIRIENKPILENSIKSEA